MHNGWLYKSKYLIYLPNLFDNIIQKVPILFERIFSVAKKYFQKVLFKGQQIGEKGKIQIEIEKLKWELKQKYHTLGKYVTCQKEIKSVIDFSHDKEYLNQINEIIKLKYYIEERSKLKGTII